MKNLADRIFAILISLSLAIPFPLAPSRALAGEAFDDGEAFEYSERVSDKELATMRGGFIGMNGMKFDFGFAARVRFNNETKMETIMASVNSALAKANAANQANNAAKTLSAPAEVARIAAQVSAATRAAIASPKASEAFQQSGGAPSVLPGLAPQATTNPAAGGIAQEATATAIAAAPEALASAAGSIEQETVTPSVQQADNALAAQTEPAGAPLTDLPATAPALEQVINTASQSVNDLSQLQSLMQMINIQNDLNGALIQVQREIFINVVGMNLAIAQTHLNGLQDLNIAALR